MLKEMMQEDHVEEEDKNKKEPEKKESSNKKIEKPNKLIFKSFQKKWEKN